jgi:signal peptide peptidase SppA
MKFLRIIEAVYKHPLLITEAGHATIDSVLRPHLAAATLPRTSADSGFNFWGERLPETYIVNNIAVIPVFGPLIQHASLIDKMCGATSYDWLTEQLDLVLREPEVEQIILHFDTPGGQRVGCAECAARIAEVAANATKPIYAYTDSQMCSAGYYLAAGCNGIFCSGSSYVGSIGVLMGFLDVSEALKTAGIKAEYIVSGKYKATASPGTSLTDDQRDYLQDLVDDAFGEFAAWVKTHRDRVQDETMQGQVFHGLNAVPANLADAIYPDLESLVMELSEKPMSKRRVALSANNPSEG